MNNMSTDKSVEKASKFTNVSIIDWSSDNTLDDLKQIQIKESTYKRFSRENKFPVDWVITADMDELIYHPNLKRILENAKSQKKTVAKTVGYNMYSDESVHPGMDLIKEIRYGSRAEMFDKPILFSSQFDMTFSAGCHPKGDGYNKMLNTDNFSFFDESILLLHYKHIGNRFLQIANRSGKRLSKNNVRRGWGDHYLKPREALKETSRRIAKNAMEVIDKMGNIKVNLNDHL